MSSQAFLWITFGIGGFTLLIFFIGRKGFVEPTKLNLRKDLRGGKVPVAPGHNFSHGNSAELHSDEIYEAPMKNLNVIFIYNGHSFDAYEVLGAPAGASLTLVEKYYQECLKQPGHDFEFIEAAFSAICSTKQ